MSSDKNIPNNKSDEKPAVPRPNLKGDAPKPPEKPKASGEVDIKDENEMPDLDSFHFMKW